MSAIPQLTNPSQQRRHQTPIVIAVFIAAFIIALFLDVPLSTLAHQSGLAPWLKNHTSVAKTIRLPGNFKYTALVCGAMVITILYAGYRGQPLIWTKPAIVFLAGILSGINAPLKWMIGRIRPYHGVPPFELHPFKYGLLHIEASYSFPSGDATIAFAMAMSLSITIPRLRPLWWTLAIIVGIERIAENAHYPSDVVAGATLGVIVALCAKMIVTALAKRMQIHPKKLLSRPDQPASGHINQGS